MVGYLTIPNINIIMDINRYKFCYEDVSGYLYKEGYIEYDGSVYEKFVDVIDVCEKTLTPSTYLYRIYFVDDDGPGRIYLQELDRFAKGTRQDKLKYIYEQVNEYMSKVSNCENNIDQFETILDSLKDYLDDSDKFPAERKLTIISKLLAIINDFSNCDNQ